jgi:long-subunit fatty acid transport protein
VIVTPGYGLRIGAAIQTPTINTINEGWQQSGETSYTDRSYDAEAQSPYGQGSYRMVSPLRANFGLAYALGQVGVISADYEVCDYSQMRYKASEYDRDYFEGVNEDIRAGFKASHSLRIGAEFKPMPELAVRAGYNLTTSPERCLECSSDLPAIRTQNASLGLGYSSKRSFFADLAVRKTFLQDEYFMPYADYMFNSDGSINENAYAPEILNKRGLWKVLLTFGWRF